MNGEAHTHEDDVREMALAIVDRTLTAIGGLETTDPMRALEIVLSMYEKAVIRLNV